MSRSLIGFALVVCLLGVFTFAEPEPHAPIVAIQPPNHSLGLLINRQPQPWDWNQERYIVYFYNILPNNAYVFGFITKNRDEIRYEKGYYGYTNSYIQEGFWSVRLEDGTYQTQYYRYPGGIISTEITAEPPKLPRN